MSAEETAAANAFETVGPIAAAFAGCHLRAAEPGDKVAEDPRVLAHELGPRGGDALAHKS